jgi:hypothetical protein
MKGTPTMSGTPLVEIPGWYINFQAAVIKQLPRPGQIDEATADGWEKNQGTLNEVLAGCLLPPASTTPTEPPKSVPNILRLISKGKILLDATDGTELLANAKDVFTGWLDGDFVGYGTNVPGSPVPAVEASVYEMVDDGDYKEVFESFNTADLDKLCFSQGQIIQFPQKYPKWLHPDGNATFLLFKVGEKLFVARVDRFERKLWAEVHRFSDDLVWYAADRLRVVVPATATLKIES